VFHTCGQTYQLGIDCAKLGLKCDPLAVCAETKASVCESETFKGSCGDDQQPLTCNDHYVERGPDCAALGLRCAEGVCKGAGEACTFFGPERQYRVEYPARGCAGNALQACVGGARHEVDCSALGPGFSCRERDGKFFCGLAAECMPGNHPDADQRGSEVTCNGSTIKFCNAGRWDQVDCKALGFRDCDSAHQACTPSFLDPLVQ
jgi:hypothetical protein